MIDGYIYEYENDLIGHGIFVYELYVKISLCTHVHSVNDFCELLVLKNDT